MGMKKRIRDNIALVGVAVSMAYGTVSICQNQINAIDQSNKLDVIADAMQESNRIRIREFRMKYPHRWVEIDISELM